jgi:glucose/arabinose dehydrogenase
MQFMLIPAKVVFMDAEPSPPKQNRWLIYVIILLALVVGALVVFLLWPKTERASPSPAVTLKTPVVRPDLVVSGLKSPTAIVATANVADQRLFVTERDGTIRIVSADGKSEAAPFLDISAKVLSEGEMGLLGLAFHPNYAQNGFFYINYIDKNQQTVIARYKVSDKANIADPASEKVLLTLKQPYKNHNGGDLVFGRDGYLYIALGDGGGAGDPENRAQDKNTLLGKILRIDIDKGDPYAVPSTNPFVGQAGAKPEIWAYGLRNPWRISFDPSSGDLYIADVGQKGVEEVNVQPSSSKGGENYGWRCFEGNSSYASAGCKAASEYTAPVLEYDHQEGRCSITGGHVYRGTQSPALVGKYFYGDYCNGQLFYTSRDDNWTKVLLTKTPYFISTFGRGSDGELYFADFKTGSIYHLQDVANR